MTQVRLPASSAEHSSFRFSKKKTLLHGFMNQFIINAGVFGVPNGHTGLFFTAHARTQLSWWTCETLSHLQRVHWFKKTSLNFNGPTIYLNTRCGFLDYRVPAAWKRLGSGLWELLGIIYALDDWSTDLCYFLEKNNVKVLHQCFEYHISLQIMNNIRFHKRFWCKNSGLGKPWFKFTKLLVFIGLHEQPSSHFLVEG